MLKTRFVTAQEELEYIRKRDGGLISPAALVDFARDPDTLLHKKFEWDDEKAGEEYRVWQARQILRVYVTVENTNKGPVETRVYVSLPDDRCAHGGGYRMLHDVLEDRDYRNQLLGAAYRDLKVFKSKYNNLKELATVFEAIDKTIAS